MGTVMSKSLNFNTLLRDASEDEFVETVYLAIRLLRYRSWIRAVKTDRREAMVYVVTKDRGKGQPDKAAQTALAIADAIAKAEGEKFEEIRDKAADSYVKSLADLIVRSSPAESKRARARANTTLAELRRDSDRIIANGLLRR